MMPRPGILDAPLIAAVRAQIDAEFGPIPSGLSGARVSAANDYRQKLARIVARAAQYVRDNGGVVVGQKVIPGTFKTTNTSDPVIGIAVVNTEGDLY